VPGKIVKSKVINQIENLTQYLLYKEEIKKIYILEVEHVKTSKPISSIVEDILHKRLKKSEFYNLLKKHKFEYRILYEIFKDKYY
jgi:hypothetical protein